MNTAALILLIIVSSVLSLFLLLLIVVLIKLLQIMQSLKRIVAKAERVADSAEAFSEMLGKAAGPITMSRFIANIVEMAKGKKHKEDK